MYEKVIAMLSSFNLPKYMQEDLYVNVFIYQGS